MNLNKLSRDFFERETLDVAKDLLGKYLIHNTNDRQLIARIIETEAYKVNDRAAHFYGGRRTERTSVVFSKGGVAYVYFIYGMYYCFNVVTEIENVPGAVLIRKLEPIAGIEYMMENRKIYDDKKMKHLCDGPGKLCMAMKITKEDNREDLTSGKLYIAEDINCIDKFEIKSGKRINIDYAGEDANLPWRFFI